jgi:serine/threonine-protein kinase
VLAPISEDSQSVIYLAHPLAGARGIVALKIYHSRDDAGAVLSRYEIWKPILATLRHPSLVKMLDVGLTTDGLLYVASAYVAGWPLTNLGSHSSIGLAERIEIAKQLTDAVSAAHAAGLAHLKLSASKIKVSTTNGLQATVHGLGSALIVDGVTGQPFADRVALAHIIRELGIVT